MGKYDIRNSQIGAVGDNASSNNNVFLADTTKVKLPDILEELNDIEKLLLSKKERDENYEKVLTDIQDIKRISEQGNLDRVLGILKSKASPHFYNLAVGVGSGIIANFIYSILNN